MADESHREPADIDKTDELPVLSEEAIFAAGGDIPTLEDEADITGEHSYEELIGLGGESGEDATQELERPDSDSDAVGQLSRDLAELRARWGSVESILEANSRAINSLQRELKLSQNELSAARRGATEAPVAPETGPSEPDRELEAALAAARSRQNALEAELDAAESERSGLQSALAQAETRGAEGVRELEAVQALAQALENDLAAARAELEAEAGELADARARLAELEAALELARRERDALQREHDSATTRSADLGQQLSAAGERAAALSAALDAEKARAAELESERDALERALAEQRDARTAADADPLQPYRDRIAALESYIAGRADRWQEMEGIVAAKTTRVLELERELEQRVSREQNLEQRLLDEQSASQMLRQKLAEQDRQIAAGEEELAALRSAALTAAAAPAPESADELSEKLQAELVAQRSRLEASEAELAAALAENETLLKRLQVSDSDLEQARQELHRLAADIEQELDQGDPAAGSAAAAKPVSAPELICLTSDRPERYVLNQARMTIGRGHECDIRIPTHYVSREHAELRREGTRIVIADLASTNGVFVNAVRVDSRELQHGDWLTIGETQFRFLDAEQSAEPA